MQRFRISVIVCYRRTVTVCCRRTLTVCYRRTVTVCCRRTVTVCYRRTVTVCCRRTVTVCYRRTILARKCNITTANFFPVRFLYTWKFAKEYNGRSPKEYLLTYRISPLQNTPVFTIKIKHLKKINNMSHVLWQ
jgi:hypothetical protein